MKKTKSFVMTDSKDGKKYTPHSSIVTQRITDWLFKPAASDDEDAQPLVPYNSPVNK